MPSSHPFIHAHLARDAAQHGSYGTDYRNTGTSSFLEHYTQRLSAVNVMHGAAERLKAINRAAKGPTVSLASAALSL